MTWGDEETSLFRDGGARRVPWFAGNGQDRGMDQEAQDGAPTFREARVADGTQDHPCHRCRRPIWRGELHKLILVTYPCPEGTRRQRQLRIHLGGRCEAGVPVPWEPAPWAPEPERRMPRRRPRPDAVEVISIVAILLSVTGLLAIAAMRCGWRPW